MFLLQLLLICFHETNVLLTQKFFILLIKKELILVVFACFYCLITVPSLDCNVIIEFVTFTMRLYDVHFAVSDCFSGNEKGQIHVQLRTQNM